MKSIYINIALFFVTIVISQTTFANDTLGTQFNRISYSTGQIEVLENLETIQSYGIEYQVTPFHIYGFEIIPSLGYSHSEDGTNYLYLSGRHDFRLSEGWITTPLFGFGYFDDGEQIKLGHEVEFISGVELTYEFYNRSRIGFKFVHLSNGGLSSTNPGTEVLSLTYSLPFD